jgi:hypothetical protein
MQVLIFGEVLARFKAGWQNCVGSVLRERFRSVCSWLECGSEVAGIENSLEHVQSIRFECLSHGMLCLI